MDSEEVLTSEEVVEDESQETPEGEQEQVETPPVDETPEVDPKDAVIGGMRRENRELRRRLEDLESKAPDEPEEKSPIDKLAEEDPYAMPDAQTLREQRKWEAKQAEKKAATQTAQEQRAALARSEEKALEDYSATKVGAGLDLETVVAIGEQYLTAGDKLDIQNGGEQAYQIAYERCKERTLKSGTADAKILQSRLDAATAKGKKPPPKTKPSQNQQSGDDAGPESDYDDIMQHIFGAEEQTSE